MKIIGIPAFIRLMLIIQNRGQGVRIKVEIVLWYIASLQNAYYQPKLYNAVVMMLYILY